MRARAEVLEILTGGRRGMRTLLFIAAFAVMLPVLGACVVLHFAGRVVFNAAAAAVDTILVGLEHLHGWTGGRNGRRSHER
jgi:hypothetical protein